MKLKVTQKQIKENYKNIISVGYCDLWYLLRYKNASYYTAGTYGWNADIYEIDYNTVIVTGYRPFGNISSNKYQLNKKYNEMAKALDSEEDVNNLLNSYIKQII